jgi:mercuric ion transport protein
MQRNDPLLGGAMRAQYRAATVCWFSLFVATVTLIFCGLPSLLVALSLGETNALWPQLWRFLQKASNYRETAFALSALLLVVSVWAMRRASFHFPPDTKLARQSRHMRHWNRWTLRVTAGIWFLGMAAAYVAVPVRIALAG